MKKKLLTEPCTAYSDEPVFDCTDCVDEFDCLCNPNNYDEYSQWIDRPGQHYEQKQKKHDL